MAEADEAQAAPKSGRLKIIIVIVVGILLAIGLSVGATLYFIGSGGEEDTAAEGDEAAAVVASLVYFEFDKPFVVTLNNAAKSRYLQVFMALSARQSGALDAVQFHMPVLQNKLQVLFSRQDPAVLQTEEGRLALQEAALEAVNEILAKEAAGTIEQVLFTNFVMQ